LISYSYCFFVKWSDNIINKSNVQIEYILSEMIMKIAIISMDNTGRYTLKDLII